MAKKKAKPILNKKQRMLKAVAKQKDVMAKKYGRK